MLVWILTFTSRVIFFIKTFHLNIILKETLTKTLIIASTFRSRGYDLLSYQDFLSWSYIHTNSWGLQNLRPLDSWERKSLKLDVCSECIHSTVWKLWLQCSHLNFLFLTIKFLPISHTKVSMTCCRTHSSGQTIEHFNSRWRLQLFVQISRNNVWTTDLAF